MLNPCAPRPFAVTSGAASAQFRPGHSVCGRADGTAVPTYDFWPQLNCYTVVVRACYAYLMESPAKYNGFNHRVNPDKQANKCSSIGGV